MVEWSCGRRLLAIVERAVCRVALVGLAVVGGWVHESWDSNPNAWNVQRPLCRSLTMQGVGSLKGTFQYMYTMPPELHTPQTKAALAKGVTKSHSYLRISKSQIRHQKL